MRRLYLDLWALLIQRIKVENQRTHEAAMFEDMGYDDCPVCLANRD